MKRIYIYLKNELVIVCGLCGQKIINKNQECKECISINKINTEGNIFLKDLSNEIKQFWGVLINKEIYYYENKYDTTTKE